MESVFPVQMMGIIIQTCVCKLMWVLNGGIPEEECVTDVPSLVTRLHVTSLVSQRCVCTSVAQDRSAGIKL